MSVIYAVAPLQSPHTYLGEITFSFHYFPKTLCEYLSISWNWSKIHTKKKKKLEQLRDRDLSYVNRNYEWERQRETCMKIWFSFCCIPKCNLIWWRSLAPRFSYALHSENHYYNKTGRKSQRRFVCMLSYILILPRYYCQFIFSKR